MIFCELLTILDLWWTDGRGRWGWTHVLQPPNRKQFRPNPDERLQNHFQNVRQDQFAQDHQRQVKLPFQKGNEALGTQQNVKIEA